MPPNTPVRFIRNIAGAISNAWNRVQLEDSDGNPIDAANPLPLSGGYAEDTAHVSGDMGIQMLAVRQDALGILSANGDYTPLQEDDQGHLKVITQGEVFTLLASAARTATAGTNGAAIEVDTRIAFAVLLTFTAKADDIDDTCDVYIDMLVGGTWVNAIHFTRVLGNAADTSAEYALLMPAAQTVTLNVSADAGSGVVRPEVMGSQIRARWIIVDPAGADASFTFGITVNAI